MAKEINIRANVDTKNAQNNVEGLNKDLDDTKSQVSGIGDQFDKMTGGAVTAFRGIVSGAKSAVLSMKTLKGAIIATGVGALVVVVGTLVSYFTNTQRGADLVDQAFATMGATVDVLIDRVSTFGEGLFQILSGDLSKGLETLTGSFKGVIDEIQKESQSALQLEKDLQKLKLQKIDFIVREKQLTAAIEEQRLAAETGETVAIRLAGTNKAIELTNKLSKERTDIAKEELRIKSAQVGLGESLNAELEEEAQAKAKLFEVEQQRDSQLKELAVRRIALNKEISKSVELAREEAEILASLTTLDQMKREGFADITPEQEIKVKQNEQMQKMLLKTNQAFAKEDEVISERVKNKKIADDKIIAHTKIMLAEQAFALAGALAEKGSKEAKLIAAAQATFSTFQGAQAAFATASANPISIGFPAYPFIQAGIATTFGLLNVKKILSTPNKGGGGGGGVPRGGSGSVAPQQNQQIVPNIDAINNGVGGQSGAGFSNMRTYIVQEDQKDSAALNQRLSDLQSA